MADQDMLIRVRMSGAKAAASEAKMLSGEIVGTGKAAKVAERRSRGMGRGFIYARKGLGPLRAGVSGLTGALGLGGAIGLAGAFKVSYEEAIQARKGHMATAAVLRSTHHAANISATGVDNLSKRLGTMAAVDDDVVRQGENMLLTFRDIRNESGKGNDIFNQTSKAALNMSAAFQAAGKSMTLPDAMLQIGKAVNDPVKGMTRLQRIGVTFTKGQLDQVAALTKSGDKLGAQRVIIRELNKEFGGSAAAQAKADPMMRLNVALKDLAQTIGTAALPYIDKFTKAATKFITGMQKGTGAGGRFVDQMKKIGKAVLPVAKDVWKVVRAVGHFIGQHPDLAKTVAEVGLAAAAFHRLGGGKAIGGLVTLIGWIRRLRKVGRTAQVAEGIAANLGTLPRKSAGPVGRFRGWFRGKMGPLGTGAGGLLGKALGAAAFVAFAAEFGPPLANWLHDHLPSVNVPGSPHNQPWDPGNPQSPFQNVPKPIPLTNPKHPRPGNMQEPRGNTPGGRHSTGGRGNKTAVVPFASGQSDQGGANTIVINHTTYLDGKPIYKSVSRHAQNVQNRR